MKNFFKRNAERFCVLCTILCAVALALIPLVGAFGVPTWWHTFYIVDTLFMCGCIVGAFLFADIA